MATHLLFARREYAEPLARIGEADVPPDPDPIEVGGDEGWLELAAIPHDAIVWVTRDGELVDEWREVLT